jgi:hypothetical protein
LFLVVLAAGIFFGWVAYRVRQFHEQAAFIADLRSRGFSIETEPVANELFWRALVGDAAVQVHAAVLWSANEAGLPIIGPRSEEFTMLKHWRAVESLVLSGSTVTDDSVQVIRRLTTLRSLSLQHTAVTDKAIELLQGLPHLDTLRIVNETYLDQRGAERAPGHLTTNAIRTIADIDGLETLDLYMVPASSDVLMTLAERLPNLTTVHLDRASVTNQGLTAIGRLTRLKQLWLNDNPAITDDGLPSLCALAQLEQLRLERTSVTAPAIKKCASCLPNLYPDWGPDAWKVILGSFTSL